MSFLHTMAMVRTFLLAVLLLCFCVPPIKAADSLELLDKAQAALIWFRSLGDEVVQRRTPAEAYRQQISPTELIQAAALLSSFRMDEQTALAEQLLAMLPYHKLTSEEMFEINDILGDTALREINEIATEHIVNIHVEAARFRNELLNSFEQVVLHREPTTALELMQAVDLLSVVDRPVLVRHYLRRFVKEDTFHITPEQSAKIVELIGTQKLYQLAANPEFVPFSQEAVDLIITEAVKHWHDKERIAAALNESDWFTTESPPRILREVLPDVKVLWKGDLISVSQSFERLKTIEDETEADQLTAILFTIRQDMPEALTSALHSDHPILRYHAARRLAQSVRPQESFLLYQFVYNDAVDESQRRTVKNILQDRKITLPNQTQAAAVLFDRATDYFERRRPVRRDTDGNVSFWVYEDGNVDYLSWDNIEAAYLHFAGTYYGQSLVILPKESGNEQNYQLAYMIAVLELEGIENRSSAPKLPMDAEELEHLLRVSLDKDYSYAAMYAIRQIEERNDGGLVQSSTGRPRILAQATVAKDPRVRFSALEAVMHLKPTESFAGSSLVAETLVWFSQSNGDRIVLSGHPQIASAMQTANLFLGLGYKTELVSSGRELFQVAASLPDVEVIVVDSRTPQPPVGDIVQILRQDARTAKIPVAILTDHVSDLNPHVNAYRRTTMSDFERRHPDSPFRTSLSLTYPHLVDEESARWVVEDLLNKTNTHPMSAEIRLELAKQSLRWIWEIKQAELSGGPKIYHFEDIETLVFDALHSERRVEEGLILAAVINSVRLRQAMLDMSQNAIVPESLREKARQSLQENVRRFVQRSGIM